MAYASGSQREIAYVKETTFGETPSSPSMAALRTTGDTLEESRQTNVSDELRSDRAITDVRHGNGEVSGEVNFELSYGAFDDMLEAVLGGEWTADVLKMGKVLRSFSLEKLYTDIGVYHVFRGCAVNTMSLNLQANAMVTGSFGIIGKGSQVADASLGEPSAAPANSPFDTFSGGIVEGAGSAPITSLSLSLENGIESSLILFEKGPSELNMGRSNLTGSVSAYFKDKSLLEKFLDEQETSIQVTLTGPGGNEYEIEIPRLKYTGGPVPTQGEGALQINLPFQALFDDGEETNIKITRTDAV